MNEGMLVDEGSVPRFQPHMKLKFDKIRQRWTILAPERLFLPDEIALEILQRCDGVATIKVIVDELADKFDTPNEVILEDVRKLVQDFLNKGVLET